ncbi:hypothetical protein OAO87_02030 [bacterium]|nr:hypothetical protein [bacterium]
MILVALDSMVMLPTLLEETHGRRLQGITDGFDWFVGPLNRLPVDEPLAGPEMLLPETGLYVQAQGLNSDMLAASLTSDFISGLSWLSGFTTGGRTRDFARAVAAVIASRVQSSVRAA